MKIAHYTTIDTAFGKIIPTQTLKFGSVTQTNDPYEAYFDWYAGMSVVGRSKSEVEELLDRNQSERERIKKSVRIACFCADGEGDSEIPCGNNHHLWTYYACNRLGLDAGCAMIFDEERLQKCLEDRNVNVAFSGLIKYFDPNSENTHKWPVDPAQLFSKKPKRWSIEHEYRIVVDGFRNGYEPELAEQEDYGRFNIQGSITEIVVPGFALNRLNKKYLEAIPVICQNEVRIFRRGYSSQTHSHDIWLEEPES